MMTEVIIKKTHEISDELWNKIVEGFNESFGLHANVDGLKSGWYVANPWGYAYHAMAFDENAELMAYNVFTPALYENGIKVVVSGSTFVRKKFRKNVMLFSYLIKALRECCVKDGFDLEVGVPNHNSLNYHLKINKVILVGDLCYYVLPIELSKTMGKSLPLMFDKFWRIVLKVHIFCNSVLSNIVDFKERQRPYSIATDEQFYKSRFRSPEYHSVSKKDCTFVYRIYDEEGKKVAYLMDFRLKWKKSYKALVIATHHIISHERVDAILYVGLMHFMQPLMIRLPNRLVPKRLPLTCCVLNKAKQESFQNVKDLNNWNFSLMSFDVR